MFIAVATPVRYDTFVASKVPAEITTDAIESLIIGPAPEHFFGDPNRDGYVDYCDRGVIRSGIDRSAAISLGES